MDLLINCIKDSGLTEQITDRRTLDGSMVSQLMNNCLDFLKITSLMKYRLYSQEMPWNVSSSFKSIYETTERLGIVDW
jgi:hypothetical protein